jgi:hypothetical protein
MRKSTIWVTIAALTVLAAVLFGQALDSVLVGNVTDSTGAAVPNATITATPQQGDRSEVHHKYQLRR